MRISKIHYILSPLLLFIFSQSISQNLSHKNEAQLLLAAFKKNHFHPRAINDNFSRQVFTRFIYMLDPYALHFTNENLKELQIYSDKIDDELLTNSWKFVPFITKKYEQQLLLSEKIIDEVLVNPLSFSSNDVLIFPEKDTINIENYNKDIKIRWRNWLKYQSLKHMEDDDLKDINANKNTDLSKTDIRNKVKLIEKRRIKRIMEQPEGLESYVSSLYFNSITSCFDPHSAYFSKSDWQSFQGELSDEEFSFGIDLEDNKTGEILIARLAPGGPAWKSNEIHKGDILLEVQWPSKDATDLAGADADEARDIFESGGSQVEIKIRKQGGQTKKIRLVKEKIRAEENIVKSFILEGERKIGYISLPGFYSEWENLSGNGCANDVAKEIVKLKQEKIEGLILDIRYNGGGAIIEGMNLAGIFINEGPLFIMKERDGKPIVAKDLNRGTIYDGPLVVMVNGQSASASELLASTLQDYNRAVIVGSATFGKATGQLVLPLDTTLKPKNKISDGPMVTITAEKLYRVTSKSAQKKGVSPDVFLDDLFEDIYSKESSYPLALPTDSVDKKVYYNPLKPLPTASLRTKSATRIESKEAFKTLRKLKASITELKNINKEITLNARTYFENKKKASEFWATAEKLQGFKTSRFKVVNTKYDKEILKVDAYSLEINDSIVQNLLADIYLEETFDIAADLAAQIKN